MTCIQTAIRSHGLLFHGLHPPRNRAVTWITTHSPTLKKWKADLAWLVHPHGTLYPRSDNMSTIDQAGKVRQPKTDVLTTDPRSQPKLTRHDTRLVFKKSRYMDSGLKTPNVRIAANLERHSINRR